MNREVHVRFCEGLGVKFPWATRLNQSSTNFLTICVFGYHKGKSILGDFALFAFL